MRLLAALFGLCFVVLVSCQKKTDTNKDAVQNGSQVHIKTITERIDDVALKAADENPGDWLTYGRNYAEDRYSTLDQIHQGNLDELGLAWTIELPSTRGVQATPIVVDGIMYFTGPWSVLYAVDVRKGETIWTYDPDVPRAKAADMCCGVVNRGVAIYKGNLFLGTMDGRLQSIDAATGKLNWSVMTVPEGNYSITGAPRVANGKIVIGNAGAELNKVRGYVTAYDAETGGQAWRFYTVPGNPKEPVEHPDLVDAMKTWTGEWWKYGGGGTVWDAIVYDPELNFVYIGVGNGTPWDRALRSPEGGDNLYLSSIVALDADTGAYQWHYQTTPGDTWDYTATQPIIQADLEIDGQMRQVLMQAPKNGYFYVIDRKTGELISAKGFSYQNWTTGMGDDGRPIEVEGARYLDGKTHWITPSSHGAHNWFPMSYNHETGLVYIPGVIMSGPYSDNKGLPTLNEDGVLEGNDIAVSLALKSFNEMVIDPDAPPPGVASGELIAYDPVKQERVWTIPQPSRYNGGLLSTTTGLLMQGDAEGMFSIRDTKTGDILKQFDVRSGVISSPVTYLVDGEQYITIIAEWGGGQGQTERFTDALYQGRVYTFKLDGAAEFPERLPSMRRDLTKRTTKATPEEIGWGHTFYFSNCIGCHGLVGGNGGSIPNIARLDDAVYDNFIPILREGVLEDIGMPKHDHLSERDVKLLREYVYFVAQSLREGQSPLEINRKLAGYQASAFAAGIPEKLSFETVGEFPVPKSVQSSPAIAAGKKAFAACRSCHSVEKDGRNLAGPGLYGIVGKDIASDPNFNYSKALSELDGVWTDERLDAYIADPKSVAPGTRMVLRERREERRSNIIAYLRSLSEE